MILSLAVALGIGLLIGVERERHKGEGPSRSSAGIRTFTIASLTGATSLIVGGEMLLATVTAGVAALVAVAYWLGHGSDPGLTSEIALVLTVILGGLSMQQPALAGGLAVTIAVLLAARSPLHRFVRSVLTDDELHDALIFAGATLIVLPLVPDRPIGPYSSLNPHTIWILMILIMAISAAAYVAVRTVGVRFGLPIAGFASGFISSTTTIGAMGARSVRAQSLLPAAVAGAVLSTLATVVQMAIVFGCHQLADASKPVDTADLRGRGRHHLWDHFHDVGPPAESTRLTARWPSLQSRHGSGIHPNPRQHSRCCGSAQGLVR
jgi:hypothetical protein